MSTDVKAEAATLATSDSKVRWIFVAPTLLVIWVVSLLEKIGVGIIATNKQFLADMHLTGRSGLVGALVTTLLFSYGIGFFVWGPIVDKIGPRKSGIIALVAWGVSTAIAAVSPNAFILILSRVLLGLSEAAFWPVSNSLTARWFPYSERGRAKSIWINGTVVGPAIAGYVLFSLLGWLDWRGVFWAMTVLAVLVCLPLFAFFVKDDPAEDSRVSSFERSIIYADQTNSDIESNAIKIPKNIFRSTNFWLISLSNTGCLIAYFSLATFFPAYLKTGIHFSSATTSNYLLLAYGIALVALVLVGIRVDKTNKKAVWAVGSFIACAFLLAISQWIKGSALVALVICLAIVFVNITTFINHGLTHSMSTREKIGRDNGFMMGVSSILSAYGPTATGSFITLGAGNFHYAFYFLAAVTAIAGILNIALMKRGF
ncbi:MFS transporter [Alicyclobacillus fastidiosus]|uniref:MFS transporter n=1 Tax=Alicyclobacillus fastidiosus TaxID=392011 RepID=A0ABV5A9K5_9BACL|nr:MFS transporter [Alicyclobacillus fastidiosus]WEH10700.1 MFS transporter [Alicyclobacillus fastidiosus]